MFQTLYLLNYNNYYNRLVKQEQTLSDYLEYEVATLAATNFNPNDHVMTQHTVNIDDDISPDYAILVDQSANIVSRWFVIESTRVRGGQYKLQLYRDTIVDFYNIIIKAPCFIEKATISNMDNPLLFNNENMSYNQILTSSNTLKDNSNCPWIVGYYAKNATELNGTVPINIDSTIPFINIPVPLENWDYYKYQDENFIGVPVARYFTVDVADMDLPRMGTRFYINQENSDITTYGFGYIYPSLRMWPVYNPNASTRIGNFKQYVPGGLEAIGGMETLLNNMQGYYKPTTEEDLNNFLSYRNQYIKDANGEIYYVEITSTNLQENHIPIKSGSLFLELSKMLSKSGPGTGLYPCIFVTDDYHANVATTISDTTFMIQANAIAYRMSFTRIQQYETKYDFSGNKLITTDAPYNIFAIPYGTVKVNNVVDGGFTLNTTKEIAMATAMGISQQQGSKVYDIQLLPYCPIPELITDTAELTVTNALQMSYITTGVNADKIGVIFNIPRSTFSINIPFEIPQGQTVINRKVNNECDKWRLTSPNYSNYFDFSAEKNDGVHYFNVDCCYKPFTPYLHIGPDFKNLYGFDDDSPRGLVLGGDFSLPQIIDQWEQYQIQNKNFQNIFDRQIQNMEINNSIQKTREIVGAVAGTFQGGVSGATAGGLVGGGAGAAVGAIAGTIVSGIAGATDVALNDQLRNEAIDFTKDQFGYQLGNIQALPHTLSKVSAFNPNNKIFPVLEYYTATDVEKEALRNKIKYNGMTIMTIGNIEEYIQGDPTYIKGQIIRLENLDSEYHLAKTIAKEINQGIYI